MVTLGLENHKAGQPRERMDLDDIKARLADRVAELAEHLTGKVGVKASREDIRFGTKGSLSVVISGPKKGAFYDNEAGVGGSPLDLIMHYRQVDFRAALTFALEWLGEDTGEREPWQPKPKPEPTPEEQARRAQAPAGMWARSAKLIGSPAETYLRSRGIETLPGESIARYLPKAWGNGRFGALIIRANDAEGALQAVQTVYVAPDGGRPTVEDLGSFQAPDGTVIAATRKRSRGNVKGSAVRLPARVDDPRLILCEGPENGLSAWQAVGCEVWIVLGSLANLAHLTLPLDRPIIIARDGDTPGSKAEAALHKVAAALVAKGVDLYVTAPETGTDLNDALQSGGDAAVRAQIDAAARYHPPTNGGASAPAMSAAEASAKLREAVATFMDEALSWDGDAHLYEEPEDAFDLANEEAPRMEGPGVAPVVGIKAPAGLGKTEAVLVDIIERAPEGFRADFYMPEHRLGDELVRRCQEIAHRIGRADLSFTVERGRNRTLPDGTPMCRKADLAEAVSRLGRPVFSTLCYRKAKNGRPEEQCEHFATCPYIAQMRENSPGIRFRPHAYLTIKQREGGRKPDMVVVDESFWQSTLRGDDHRSFLVMERLSALREVPSRPGVAGRYDDDATADLHDIAGRVLAVFREKERPGATDFIEAGISAGDCRFAMGLEYKIVEAFAVSPAMPSDLQRQAISAAKASEANKMARFWRLLTTEIENGRDPLRSIVPRRDVLNRNGDLENRLYMRWSADLQTPNVPMLLIDADLDAEVARRFLPAMRDPVTIEAARQNVHIVQISDRPVSMRMLCSVVTDKRTPPEEDRQRAQNRRRDLRAFLEIQGDAALRAGRPPGLAVTYMDAETAMLADGELTGCDLAHFGAIRGKDQWRDASFVAVAGRPQPSVRDLEWQTAALFWRDTRPLEFLEPEPESTSPRFVSERHRFDTRDPAHSVPVAVDMHPDPLCMTVLRQIRECEITQALDRARLIHRTAENPCTVFLLTNTPLPGVTVDRVTTWDQLMPSRWERAFVRHGVLPLAHAAQAAAFPDLWPTEGAAKQAAIRLREKGYGSPIESLLGKRTPLLETLSLSSKGNKGSGAAAVREALYRLPGARGRPSRALLRSDLPDPRDALELVVGPVSWFEIVEDGAGQGAEAPVAAPSCATGLYAGPVETELEPDPDQIREQVAYWFAGMQSGQIEIGWTNRQTGKIDHARRFGLDELDALAAFAAEVNRTPGQSVYFRPALLKANGGGFERATGIWADLDEPGTVENVRHISPLIRPNMVVVTGNLPHLRAQLFWRLADPIIGAETVEGLNGRAGALYSGDAQVFPAVNFMRLAGTIAWPWKTGRRIELTELHLFDDRPQSYPLLDLARALPDAVPPSAMAGADGSDRTHEMIRTGYWMRPTALGAAGARNDASPPPRWHQ